MEKNRKTTALVIAALVVSVISLGVAFAAFSTQLNINGTAKIAATNWNIHFSTTNGGAAPAQSGVTITPSTTQTGASTVGTLTGTDFTWAATFKTPGDKVQYHFYVVNSGDYNATLTSIGTPQVTCTIGDPAVAETTYCSKISYTLSHDANGNDPVAVDETLNAGASTEIYVTAQLTDYTDTISTPPTADITTNAITNTLVYTQSGNAQN